MKHIKEDREIHAPAQDFFFLFLGIYPQIVHWASQHFKLYSYTSYAIRNPMLKPNSRHRCFGSVIRVELDGSRKARYTRGPLQVSSPGRNEYPVWLNTGRSTSSKRTQSDASLIFSSGFMQFVRIWVRFDSENREDSLPKSRSCWVGLLTRHLVGGSIMLYHCAFLSL